MKTPVTSEIVVTTAAIALIATCALMLAKFGTGRDTAVTPLEIRTKLNEKCKGKIEVQMEIQTMLPDNDIGLITPKILRDVLNDVVERC